MGRSLLIDMAVTGVCCSRQIFSLTRMAGWPCRIPISINCVLAWIHDVTVQPELYCSYRDAKLRVKPAAIPVPVGWGARLLCQLHALRPQGRHAADHGAGTPCARLQRVSSGRQLRNSVAYREHQRRLSPWHAARVIRMIGWRSKVSNQSFDHFKFWPSIQNLNQF
jgi:hypothetical protein